MGWLQENMRDDAAESHPNANGLSFGGIAPPKADNDRIEAIDLVQQAADLIRCKEARAAEIEARAHDLARRAVEQLNLAERRVHSAEAGRRAAEAGIATPDARGQEIGKELHRNQTRISA